MVRARLSLAPLPDAERGLVGHVEIRIIGIELRREHGEPVLVLPPDLAQQILAALGLGGAL